MEYTDSVFNTTPLISELSNVLESGVKSILKDFIDRYILLEETQKKILQILGGNVNPSCSSSSITQSVFGDETAYKKEILLVLSEMTDIIRGLKSEIQELKEAKRAESVCHPIVEKNILREPVAEKENIKLEIEEPEEEEDEEQKEEEEEPAPTVKEESEDEDDEEEDDDEDDEEEESEDEQEPVPAQEEKEEPTPVQEDEEQKKEPDEEQDEEQKEEQDEEQDEEQKEEQDEEQKEEQDEEEPVTEQKEQEPEPEQEPEDEESEQEEEELFEIDIDDVTFCTNDDQNGFIYELLEDSEVGKKIGYFKEGEPIFYDSS